MLILNRKFLFLDQAVSIVFSAYFSEGDGAWSTEGILGKPQKKSSLNGLTPPASLLAVGKLEHWKKKVPKKVIFVLMVRPFTPPPLLMARTLREELFLRLPLLVLETGWFALKKSIYVKKCHNFILG